MNKQIPDQIDNESHYQETLNILNKQNKPSKMLCILMNMLESYRQSRKMGWSRPWNKYGLKTFQSFKLNAQSDSELCHSAQNLISQLEGVPTPAVDFIQQLLASPETLMGFLFFSEYTEDKQQYETATLSLGRKVSGNARVRDRFDIIFDALIKDNTAQALGRIRIFVDPYLEGNKEPLWSVTLTDDIPADFFKLFAQLSHLSWQWQSIEEKHWDHWTSRYIDYFGPRSVTMESSHFYQPSGQRFKAT